MGSEKNVSNNSEIYWSKATVNSSLEYNCCIRLIGSDSALFGN